MSDAPDKAEVSTTYFRRPDPPEAQGAFLLTVVDGPDRGATLTIDAALPFRALVGSSVACQLRLTDPTVSRRHLALEVKEGLLHLGDAGSRNGTRVNGILVREAIIEEEASLSLGATELRVERAPRTPGALPAPTAVGFGRVLGATAAMRRLYPLCAKLAASDIPVVIEGETGTGKEALAEALHEEGRRRDGPFVVVDCTTIPAQLMEAELFGHERGAFTGADRARKGVFAEAHGGTIFIDEIGELEPALQPKLLRAIDRGEVRPVGGRSSIGVDVRIIAATRRDLDKEVQAGRFRDDLFHRLAIGRIELPPLRRRAGDIPLLARHFWTALGGAAAEFPAELVAGWQDEPWPGNVRELKNTVARFLALGELARLQPAGRAATTGAGEGDEQPLDAWLEALLDLPLGEARARVVERFEEAYVTRMLARTGGNVTRAAEQAGVARRYFRLLKARLGEDR